MKDRRVVAIVQARMGSKRLPGKVLAKIAGEPMIVWVVERAGLASLVDTIVVATTTDPEDDRIATICRERGYAVHRGDPLDVLDRYWETAKAFDAAIVVRITADCPLIDPELIDKIVEVLLSSEPAVDFAANRLPLERTYPIGLDVEACTIDALYAAWEGANEPHQREHVMPYIYENPERFRIVQLQADKDYGTLRWTVDTQQDLDFIQEIAARLPDRSSFGWRDVLEILNQNPELAKINANVSHKTHRDVG